ncbi:PAS domain-containing sensor histidine kinase [Gramella sp. AN32]|uniref:histidine kinase n=1 Tax=Christiangramia antarctica TaxID=2058158 RepID=A0ABW5X1Y5_9FLAO|nr:PAS domain-containing sensor histidine kinase [Gramella sp. AN32]MCM4155702.1 PAS domain-containing sensor histidine kinase [Gramella sp. AN32]
MNEPTIPARTEEILSAFFELSHDYLCIAGYDGYFRKVNPAFINLIGYTEQELLSFPICDLIYEPDRVRTAEIREGLKIGSPLLNFENRYVTKSGEIIWLTWTSIPEQSNGLVYAIAKNINHIKNQAEERNALIADLTSLNKELTHLSYTATHDLKSPVNNLISLFSLLDYSEIKNEDNLLYMDLLKQSTESLRDILNNYIDNIKEKNKSLVKPEKINLHEVVKDTLEPIKYLIKDTKTSFNINFSEVEFLNFNSFYLHSIFLNLVSNSIKYARSGVPPIISITSKKTPDSIQVIFGDNGLGFDMEKIGGRIFGLNETFHGHSESKGVGLYLVNDYMRALGGSVAVTSEVNKGSAFTLNFRH